MDAGRRPDRSGTCALRASLRQSGPGYDRASATTMSRSAATRDELETGRVRTEPRPRSPARGPAASPTRAPRPTRGRGPQGQVQQAIHGGHVEDDSGRGARAAAAAGRPLRGDGGAAGGNSTRRPMRAVSGGSPACAAPPGCRPARRSRCLTPEGCRRPSCSSSRRWPPGPSSKRRPTSSRSVCPTPRHDAPPRYA